MTYISYKLSKLHENYVKDILSNISGLRQSIVEDPLTEISILRFYSALDFVRNSSKVNTSSLIKRKGVSILRAWDGSGLVHLLFLSLHMLNFD